MQQTCWLGDATYEPGPAIAALVRPASEQVLVIGPRKRDAALGGAIVCSRRQKASPCSCGILIHTRFEKMTLLAGMLHI
jgi:hypothetical protein